MDHQRLQVLLVSALPTDLDHVRDLLGQTGVGVDLHVARDAIDAVQLLGQEGDFAGAAPPDLVLLDLELPDDGASRVLTAVRDDPGRARVQVLAILGEGRPAQLDAVAEFPLHDTVERPLELSALRRAIAYFGEL